MKDKFGRSKSWGNGVHTPRGSLAKRSWKVILIVLLAVLTFVVLWGPGYLSDLPPDSGDELVHIRAYEKDAASNVVQRLSYRNASFNFKPKIANLNIQRKNWLKANPHVRAGRPKVLLVTGSQPNACDRAIDTHLYLKAAKNKIHYCRLHDIQMHYTMLEPDAELSGSWAKLPVIRMLMLAHPEVEWFWWVDSDSLFTDMKFELPLGKYQDRNLILHGDENRVHKLKDWQGLMTGNFLIRNCQWSLHLLDAWGSMGPAQSRRHYGEILSGSLIGRPQGLDADEQSALVYLLATEKKLWAPKVYFEKDFYFTGAWVEVAQRLEEMEKLVSGDPRLPVVTHFAGCSRCAGNTGEWPWEQCQREMERTMSFADNQVYHRYGYQLRNLESSELVPIPGFKLDTVEAAESGESWSEYLGVRFHKLPGPKVRDWDAQRQSWFRKNPAVKRTNEHGHEKMMIVTGSSPRECNRPMGSHLLLKALKNKVDYARFHDLEMFYGMADFDQQLNDWWTKIPTIRMLMLTRPDIEWFWWCDGDAIITDMVFDLPFENYRGQNLLLYGDKELVYERHDWIGINAGVYLIRNCQWSLDLFDVWASFGTKTVRAATGKSISELLVGREPNIEADDQSALLYLLIMDKKKQWTPKVCLERSVTISGYWKIITNRFEEMKKISHAGLGNMDWPWITHFAGCQPCGTKGGNFQVEECLKEMLRSFDFAENQIIEIYGLEHSPLGSAEVRRLNPR